jgi:hypothetical protein
VSTAADGWQRLAFDEFQFTSGDPLAATLAAKDLTAGDEISGRR